MFGFRAEAVAVVNAFRLCALAAMTFGLNLTTIQLGAMVLALEAVLTLFTRSQVTSGQTLQNMTPATLLEAQQTSAPAKDIVKKLP